MLDFLKDIVDYDALFFLPMKEDDEINIVSNRYKNPGIPMEETLVGPWWHVILFQTDEETGEIDKFDSFDAVLSDPREYISGLIPQGWYGVIAKKTTTSPEFYQDALDKFATMM
jgi:hypothetical protein